MHNDSSAKPSGQRLGWVITLGLIGLLLSGYFVLRAPAQAIVPVSLGPIPQLQLFDQSGRPLSFGCVFTYQTQSTNPLATYTDSSGQTQNSNPVILSAGGSANIWIQAGLAYTYQVKSAGGTRCASGTTQMTINGIGGGTTILTTVVPYSPTPVFPVAAQIQLFTITLTGNATAQPLSFVGVSAPAIIYFQITQDGTGSHTFSWPSNSVGGCTIGSGANIVTTQEFVYNGNNATAVGPCVIGNGPAINAGAIVASTVTASGKITGSQLASTIATGTPPFIVNSATLVPNLNVAQLEGGTWEVPGTIGVTTPNTGKFTTLNATTSLTINGGTPQTGIQGTDTKLATAGTFTGSTGAVACKDANSGITTVASVCLPSVTGSSGHIVFPGGVIMQWFNGGSVGPGNTDNTISLPFSFPNACDSVQLTYLGANGTNGNDWLITTGCTTTTVDVSTRSTGGTDQASVGVFVFAIGH